MKKNSFARTFSILFHNTSHALSDNIYYIYPNQDDYELD